VLFGTLAHAVARRALEDELGQRLATAASGVAMQILPSSWRPSGSATSKSNTYANLTRRIELARQRLACGGFCLSRAIWPGEATPKDWWRSARTPTN